jgi:copper chaperone
MITMETLKFKTNIKCSGCVAGVTPALNETVGQNNWTVDIQNPDKILTVMADDVTTEEVQQAVKKAGFQAEIIR